MAETATKAYNPWVTIRNAAWVAFYAAAPVALVTLTEGLKEAEGQWWYPVLAAVLGAIGSWLRFRRKNP